MKHFNGDDGVVKFLEEHSKNNPSQFIDTQKEQILVGLWYSYHFPFSAALHRTHRYFLNNYKSVVEVSLDRDSNYYFKVWLTDIYHFISNNYFSTINDAANYVLKSGKFDNLILQEA